MNFEPKPDGTGYEQAPCPVCGYVCMTVAFHEQEQERSRAGRVEFLEALSPIIFTGYGFLVPLFCLLCVVVTEIVAEGIVKDDEYCVARSRSTDADPNNPKTVSDAAKMRSPKLPWPVRCGLPASLGVRDGVARVVFDRAEIGMGCLVGVAVERSCHSTCVDCHGALCGCVDQWRTW